MMISGLQKLTLLDFPQKVACTVFLGGCNLRCPFCQNGEILDGRTAGMTEDDFFAFLKKRQKILDGVCVSGGEPLLHEGIFSFIEKIRALGYAVKLDTNGTFPVRLKRLVQEKLIDYVAMDIKNSPKKYARTAGTAVDLENIRESAAFLMESDFDYEFRTTVVAKYHRAEDFIAIGEWLRGAKKYFHAKLRRLRICSRKGTYRLFRRRSAGLQAIAPALYTYNENPRANKKRTVLSNRPFYFE